MPKIIPISSKNLSSTEKYLQGMQILVEVVQELSLARDMKKIQEIVVRTARLLTGADGATFVLRDGNFCHYIDEEAIAPLWKGKKFPMEICVSGWVMLNRKPIIIKDIYKDPRIPIDAYRPTFVKSLAMVPIRTIEPIGAIGNYWSSFHQLSKEELELLQALADTTAVALENVQVYDELEERVRARTAELQAANEAIQRLSIHDELTSLYNRRGFYLLAEQELKRAQREDSLPTVIFIDIDGLKEVNDQLGHEIGDQLIMSAANVIKQTMRDSDIVGRLGGDEFCIMALDCNAESMWDRLQKMIDKFNEAPHPFKLSMSVGMAQLEINESLDSLISRADQEMYVQKRSRKQSRT